MELKCICGNIFYKSLSVIKKGQGKYCSKKCADEYGRTKYRDVIRKCKNCGKDIKITCYRKNVLFCSLVCAGKYNKPKVIDKECDYCGEKFTPRHNKSNKKFCSFECSMASRRVNEDRISRLRLSSWKTIRRNVWERDNYICKICGKKCEKGEQQAHHIKKWTEVDKNNELENLVTLCVSCHAKAHYHNGTPGTEKTISYLESVNSIALK